MELQDKVVLITGASSGIGEASAKAFDKAGAKLVLVARRRERLMNISSQLHNAIVFEADLNNVDQAVSMIDKTVDHFGKIDILINNAASIIDQDINFPKMINCFINHTHRLIKQLIILGKLIS
jgi:NADP-dependent 3-hydroxy acid dehydrogenase YdfG